MKVIEVPPIFGVDTFVEVRPDEHRQVKELILPLERPRWIEAILDGCGFDDAEEEHGYAAAMERRGWVDVFDVGLDAIYQGWFGGDL